MIIKNNKQMNKLETLASWKACMNFFSMTSKIYSYSAIHFAVLICVQQFLIFSELFFKVTMSRISIAFYDLSILSCSNIQCLNSSESVI